MGLSCVNCLPIAAGVDLDPAQARVLWHGLWIVLPPLQYAGLRYLAEHRGVPVRAEELGESLWGAAAARLPRRVQTLVRRLRRKLEQDPRRPQIILTVVGAGYVIPR